MPRGLTPAASPFPPLRPAAGLLSGPATAERPAIGRSWPLLPIAAADCVRLGPLGRRRAALDGTSRLRRRHAASASGARPCRPLPPPWARALPRRRPGCPLPPHPLPPPPAGDTRATPEGAGACEEVLKPAPANHCCCFEPNTHGPVWHGACKIHRPIASRIT